MRFRRPSYLYLVMSTRNLNLEELHNPAKLLLLDVFELYSLEPDYKGWAQENFEEGSPRDYLLQRIQALMRSLQFKNNDVDALFNADEKRLIEVNLVNLFSRFPSLVALKKNHSDSTPSPSLSPFFYEHLFRHALNISTVLKLNAGVMAASGFNGMVVEYTESLNTKIALLAQEELDILEYLFNANEKLFSLQQLHEKYDYPLVDLDEIMVDWL